MARPSQYDEHAPTERSQLLQEAIGLIDGERNASYGEPYDDFSVTAEFWSTYINRIFNARYGNTTIQAHDVAAMMILLKLSRLSWTPEKRDHWVDIAGYAACGYECVKEQQDDSPF